MNCPLYTAESVLRNLHANLTVDRAAEEIPFVLDRIADAHRVHNSEEVRRYQLHKAGAAVVKAYNATLRPGACGLTELYATISTLENVLQSHQRGDLDAKLESTRDC